MRISGFQRQMQVSNTPISNCIPYNTVECNYSSLFQIPAAGTKGLTPWDKLSNSTPLPLRDPWASCQIRSITHCACAGIAGLVVHTSITAPAWRMLGSLTSCCLWSRWRGKCPRHSRRMRNLHFFVCGKRSMVIIYLSQQHSIHHAPSWESEWYITEKWTALSTTKPTL